MSNQPEKDKMLNPISRYYGEFKPENLVFNANLQEFANRINIICALETGGKISPTEAYQEVKKLWTDLRKSKKSLLDNNSSS